jgi:hypothetical protein
VLASVFSAHGSYASPQAFTHGVTAALPVGAVVLAIGAVIALLVPKLASAQGGERGEVGIGAGATEGAVA